MQIKDDEAKKLELGAAKLLKLEEPDRQLAEEPCQHEDDGHIYGETARRYILRCSKCGEYYEEKKIN